MGRPLPLRNLVYESIIIDLINYTIVGYSAPVQTGPGAHPASYTMGTESFAGGKAAGAWR